MGLNGTGFSQLKHRCCLQWRFEPLPIWVRMVLIWYFRFWALFLFKYLYFSECNDFISLHYRFTHSNKRTFNINWYIFFWISKIPSPTILQLNSSVDVHLFLLYLERKQTCSYKNKTWSDILYLAWFLNINLSAQEIRRKREKDIF